MDRTEERRGNRGMTNQPTAEAATEERTFGFFIEIGNSDNKLTQKEWSEFCCELLHIVHALKEQKEFSVDLAIFGVWFSESASPWQNMCIHFGVQGYLDRVNIEGVNFEGILKGGLIHLAQKYRQDAIALTTVREPGTELITAKKRMESL